MKLVPTGPDRGRSFPRTATRLELSAIDGSCHCCGRVNDGRMQFERHGARDEYAICAKCVSSKRRVGVI